ncbi:MAG TPA: outer membrane beta-barrel protein [Flavobacteriales bacterium]|nr:outer membrane beta-barrel protein [Flavobacteriales bacterium]
MKTIVKMALVVTAIAGSISARAGSSVPDTTKKTDCKNDSTKMTFKNFDLVIIERNQCEETKDTAKAVAPAPKEKFSTWSGLYLGVNGLLTPGNSLNIGSDNKFLELDYSKSITFGINFSELKFKIVPKYVTLTTGLGVQWNKYAFKNNYTLNYNSDSVYGMLDSSATFTKNKLSATYLQVPLMFEIKTHERLSKAFHLGFGVIGAYKLGSNLKQEFSQKGFETEGKFKGHYQLNPFQLYATARIGYGKHFTVFANYGLMPVFESKKGPDLRPFTVGIYLPF